MGLFSSGFMAGKNNTWTVERSLEGGARKELGQELVVGRSSGAWVVGRQVQGVQE